MYARSKDDRHEGLSSSGDDGSKDSEEVESHLETRRESEQFLEGDGRSLLYSAGRILQRQSRAQEREDELGDSHLLLNNLALGGGQRSQFRVVHSNRILVRLPLLAHPALL